ncbi:MAG: hypothetical protein JW781_05525 [Deltaproteobacteria bacterium]|nr:hypothetical protein [Candidatus Anaeroferrophillacea bacterium]
MRGCLRRFRPLICLVAIIIIAQPLLAGSQPLPDIRINGVDGPLSLSPADELTISLSMDCQGVSGRADWWLAAGTPFGFYYMTPAGGWDAPAAPTLQGDIFGFGATTLFTVPLSGFPAGSYVIYFGVDTVPDGQLTIASLSYDDVSFVIGAGVHSAMTIGAEGGVLEVANQRGDLIRLSIPSGAILNPTLVSLTALADIPLNPIATNVLPGVIVQPHGLLLHEPATFSVDLVQELDSPSTSLLLYIKDSSLVLPIGQQAVTTDRISGLIYHFSTYTAGDVTGGEAAAQAEMASTLPSPADPYGWQDTYDVCDALLKWGEIVELAGGDGQKYIDKAVEAAKRDAANFLQQPVPADPCGDYLDVLFKYADLLMRLTSGPLVSDFQNRINDITAECSDAFRIDYSHVIQAQGISWNYAGTIKFKASSDRLPAEVRETMPGQSSLTGGGTAADCIVSITGSVTTTLDRGQLSGVTGEIPMLNLVLVDSWSQTATVTCPEYTGSMSLPQTFIHPLTFRYEDGYTITQPAGESGSWRWTLHLSE